MGLAHSPRIVTDGLVLALDAANPKSYPGSGTTWTDLSGNGNNGTLVNSPTYLSDNNGIFLFDGVNDYTTVPDGSALIQNKTNFTIGITFNMQSFGSLRGLIGCLNYYCSGNLGLVADSTTLSFYNDTITCSSIHLYSILELNKWITAYGTYDGTTTRLYCFKNGALSQTSGTSKTGVTNTFVSDFQVFGDQYGPYYTNCLGSSAFVYNRTLTEAEIIRNFNATRGRYGI